MQTRCRFRPRLLRTWTGTDACTLLYDSGSFNYDNNGDEALTWSSNSERAVRDVPQHLQVLWPVGGPPIFLREPAFPG